MKVKEEYKIPIEENAGSEATDLLGRGDQTDPTATRDAHPWDTESVDPGMIIKNYRSSRLMADNLRSTWPRGPCGPDSHPWE